MAIWDFGKLKQLFSEKPEEVKEMAAIEEAARERDDEQRYRSESGAAEARSYFHFTHVDGVVTNLSTLIRFGPRGSWTDTEFFVPGLNFRNTRVHITADEIPLENGHKVTVVIGSGNGYDTAHPVRVYNRSLDKRFDLSIGQKLVAKTYGDDGRGAQHLDLELDRYVARLPRDH